MWLHIDVQTSKEVRLRATTLERDTMFREKYLVIFFTGKPKPRHTIHDTDLQDRGMCEFCVEKPGTVFCQSPSGERELLLCTDCYKSVEKRYPEMANWTTYPYARG